MTDEPQPPAGEQSEERSLIDVAAVALPPAAILAQPLVTKLVNRPPKPEPPKVELPPGVPRE